MFDTSANHVLALQEFFFLFLSASKDEAHTELSDAHPQLHLIRPVTHSNAGAVVCIFNERQQQRGLKTSQISLECEHKAPPVFIHSICFYCSGCSASLKLMLSAKQNTDAKTQNPTRVSKVVVRHSINRHRQTHFCRHLSFATKEQKKKKKKNQFFLQAFFFLRMTTSKDTQTGAPLVHQSEYIKSNNWICFLSRHR